MKCLIEEFSYHLNSARNEFNASGGGYFQDDISGEIRLVLGMRSIVLLSMFAPHWQPQGILPSGAAYILAPKSKEFQPYRRKPLYRSSDYASLSPIQFLSPSDLEVTLKPLNEFRKWSEKEDNSAANKRYNQTCEIIFLLLVRRQCSTPHPCFYR